MKNKDINDVLRKKLGDFRADPPPDIWDRIRATLDSIPIEGDMSVQEPGGGKLSSPRLNRTLLRWGSIAAAASVAIAVTVLSLNRPATDILITSDTGTELPFVQSDNLPDTVLPEIEDLSSESLRVTVRTAVRQRLTGSNVSDIKMAQTISGDSTSYKIVDTLLSPDTTGLEATPIIQTDDNTGNRSGGSGKTITSDMKGRGGSADFERAFAEVHRRRRRTTPVTTSLYAMNSASRQNVAGNVIGGTMLYKTDHPYANTSAVAESSSHKLPVSVGANINIGLTDRLSIETGLVYTFLKSELEWTMYDLSYRTEKWNQKLHYLGIPVSLRYDFLDHPRWRVYASAGGMVEKLVTGKLEKDFTSQDQTSLQQSLATVDVRAPGLQASVNGAVGIELKIVPMMGLYLEPGLSYYFKNNNQPDNYRTENPLHYSMRAGLRFSFGK